MKRDIRGSHAGRQWPVVRGLPLPDNASRSNDMTSMAQRMRAQRMRANGGGEFPQQYDGYAGTDSKGFKKPVWRSTRYSYEKDQIKRVKRAGSI